MTFQGKLIRHGGVFPVRVLRLFRRGAGECENRWMDEHIKVAGGTVNFEQEMIDDNLNSLSWWITTVSYTHLDVYKRQVWAPGSESSCYKEK